MQLDMRGKPCPIPVVEAKKALAGAEVSSVCVLVDNAAAIANLHKMADGLGYTFAAEPQDNDFTAVFLTKKGQAQVLAQPLQELEPDSVVLITSDTFGRGDEKLGKILLKGFLFALTETAQPPKTIVFLHGGAALTCAPSNVIGDLEQLQKQGCDICTCGTCLDFYGLAQHLQVGRIVNMMDIANFLTGAKKVITL